ncbi:MAG: ABC transporter substrate-binding protein [Chloroflexi bacterium]|nr:ABC transporter substrate-binding protein [Chloroflexota bacterium]
MFTSGVPKLLAVLVLLGLLAASCAPAGAPPPATGKGAPATTPAAQAETPKYGGVLTSYIAGNPPSLDAQQEPTTNTSHIVAPMYNSLVQPDPLTSDKYVPAVAEKWEMSQDGLTWTLHIRQGVKFHDGTTFTADDAIFNFKRVADPPKGFVSNLAFILKPAVKSIAKEENKVKIVLNYPFPILLDNLAHNYLPMYSQAYVEKNGDMKTTVMGTGPFKFKSYNPGVGLEAVKNENYWVKGRPYLDGYQYLFIKDESTRLAAFKTGKVNMTEKRFAVLQPKDVEALKKEQPDLKFYPTNSPLGPWFFMNTRKPPFQDQRVRKAINLVIDRQAAMQVLGQGAGIIGKFFPVEPWGIPMDEFLKMPGWRQPKDADIAEAKKLMADAGFASGFELTMLARQMAQSKEPAVFMTDQLAKLGIKSKVQTLEDVIFWDNGRKATHEAMVYTPPIFFPDPHWLGRFFAPGGTLNFAGNENDKELVALWDEQIKTVDPERRKAVIRKVEEHLMQSVPGAPILWYLHYIGVRPEVKNYSQGISDFVGNSLQELWLAK